MASPLRTSILTLALVLAFAPSARADEGLRSSDAIEQSLRFDVGLFSPVGELGVTYSVVPMQHLELEAGLGLGLSGFEVSLMPRFVAGSHTHRFVTGAGISLGFGAVQVVDTTPTGDVDHTIVMPWLNVDAAGYEYVGESGFTFTVSAGVAVSLTHGCADGLDDCVDLAGLVVPQVRIGIGRTF